MYKFQNNLSPKFMKEIFQEQIPTYSLRTKKIWGSRNYRTVYWGTESLNYRGPKTWQLVPTDIKNSSNLSEFKQKIRRWKPVGCTCRLCKIFVPELDFI